MTYSACYAGIGQAPDYHGVDQYVPASLVDRNGAPPNRVPPPNRVFVWWPKRLAVAKATDRNYWLAELIEENCEPPGTKKNKRQQKRTDSGPPPPTSSPPPPASPPASPPKPKKPAKEVTKKRKDIKQSIKVLSISSKDELPSSSHDTLLVELHTKMNSVLDHVREIEHKLDIYIQKPQLELFSSASDSPQFPPPPAVSPQLTLPPAMSSQFPPPPATTSQFPPPPATTSQFPPPPATSSQFPPPPATTSQFPPPPATTSQFPPPPATSSQFPTPPATSSQLPPPPATSSQFPPPPATSSQLPPPPATTSQFPPPPATSSQFPPPPATSPQLPPPPATTSQLPPPPATSSQFPPPPATSPQFTLPQFPPPPALSSTSPQFSPPYASSCASSSLMAESLVNEFLHEDFTEFLRSAASYSESLPGGRSLSPMAESFRSEPVTPTKVENPPPPPFSTPPRLRPVRDAVAMVPGTDNSSLRKLTIAIARESIFGPKEMDTMTLSGRNNTIVFDRTKLDYIERIVYNRVSDRKGQGEFELIWSQCLNSLTKACQNLRKKYPIIID